MILERINTLIPFNFRLISLQESGDESVEAIELEEVCTSDPRLNVGQDERSQDGGGAAETGTVNSGFCKEESTWLRTHQEDDSDEDCADRSSKARHQEGTGSKKASSSDFLTPGKRSVSSIGVAGGGSHSDSEEEESLERMINKILNIEETKT